MPRERRRTSGHPICCATNLTPEQVRETFSTPETVPFWQLPYFIDMAERAGLAASGYRLQYQKLLARPFMLAAMVLLAAAFSLRFFRMGGVQKMVLGGVASGFLLYVMSKLTDDLSKAELLPPMMAAWMPAAIGAMTGFVVLVVPGGRLMAGGATTRASLWRKRVKQSGLILLSAAAIVAGCWFDIAPAQAQLMTLPGAAAGPETTPPRPQGEKSPMLLQAIEIHYDYNNKRVSAVGNVQIYYNGTTIEADKVIYDETTKRMHAEGNVRLTEPDGRITYADAMDLSDDFRDGFVDSLRLDTPDKTRMAAARADRTSGTFTVFHSGVYTACEPCKDDPKKPPLWQVKGGADDPRLQREDDLFRGCAPRILRQAGRLYAVLLRARSDGEAQVRLPDAVRRAAAAPTASASRFRITGRWRPITT